MTHSASSTDATKQALTVQPQLSPRAARFVARHPEQLDRIVAVALEAAAAQELEAADTGERPELLSKAPPLPAALQRFVQPGPAGRDEGLLNLTEAAEQLGVTRATVYAWIDQHRLLAWNATRRGPVVPAEQILGPRRPVEGIAQLLEIMEDPAVVWAFLSEVSEFLDPPQRPLEALKAGRLEAVLAAAQSYGTAFS